MKPKEYPALEEAVEIGVNFGWVHAHKHVEHPTEGAIKEQIVDDVMNAICERWDFESPADEIVDALDRLCARGV